MHHQRKKKRAKRQGETEVKRASNKIERKTIETNIYLMYI